MNNIWRLCISGANNGSYNMAVDDAIAIASRKGVVPVPTLRFYAWSSPTISIGYFQKYESLLDEGGLIQENIPVVRRITGGRAVFHGNDLSYSVVCRNDNRLFPGNLKGAFYTVTEALINGLGHLGITPDLIAAPDAASINKHQHVNRKTPSARTLQYFKSTLCFSVMLGHEITVKGKKLMGSAQRRWPEAFLQHGSILINGPQKENGHNAISFNEIPGMPMDTKKIISALCAGFCSRLGITLIEGHLTGYEMDLAKGLMEERYSKDSWNKRL